MAVRPAAEIDVTDELVRGLLREQFPELADLAIQPLSRGWDNTNVRLGDELLVRVPHRKVAAPLIEHEQRWLPTLAPKLDLAIPTPTHAGRPTDRYPWHWSVTPWIDGTEAAQAELTNTTRSAQLLGEFFGQLHVPAPDDAPPNPYRGCPIADRRSSFETNLTLVDDGFDRSTMTAIFERACSMPTSTERVWLHGDLHTRNMVVANGQLAAVIDWGDICSGDRATDLAGAFMLVPNQLATVKKHAGANDHDWTRAAGWAINFAAVYLAHSDDDPIMGAIGARLVDTLLTNERSAR